MVNLRCVIDRMLRISMGLALIPLCSRDHKRRSAGLAQYHR